MIVNLIAVAFGGACGAVMRYLTSEGMNILIPSEHALSNFPVATFFANIVGCFLIGILSCFFARDHFLGSDAWRFFVITGVLGGFTTFSTFSWESITLLETRPALGATYVIATLVLCLTAAFAGRALGKFLWQANA